MTISQPAAFRFTDQVVIVTGGGRGIGRGTARRFAAEGARVAVVDENSETCNAVAKEIVDAGGQAIAVVADLGDPSSRAGILGEVLEWSSGRLDVLVNNAACHGPRVELASQTDADIRRVIEVNLVAPLLLSRDALPSLIKTRGAIVMVSSIQLLLPLPTFVTYVATKGAIEGITRALAVEAAPSGIRVNAVAPGAVESPSMREQWEATTGSSAAPRAPTLVGRWGTDNDIAEVILFLSSSAAAYISGEVIRSDGGRLLSRNADPLDTRK